MATSSPPADVLSRLREFLRESALQPGDRLPPERILAERLKAGRPAVREAIKALSILDVLESRRGAGTFLKSISALQANWPQHVAALDADFDMLQLLEVRKMIEPRAAALAAARASAPQLRELERTLAAVEACGSDRSRIAEADYHFHDAIVQAAQNPILSDLVAVLKPRLMHSRRLTAASQPGPQKMNLEHRAIYQAVRQGQSELAERAMLDHLHSIGLDLITQRTESSHARHRIPHRRV